MGDPVIPAAGLRVHASRDENEALKAQGRTLMDCSKLAVVTNFPPDAVAQMGPHGIAATALQVALTAVLKSPDAQSIPHFETVGFSIGVAFGEMLRHAAHVDLGPIAEAIGNGMTHALTFGHEPVGGPQ